MNKDEKVKPIIKDRKFICNIILPHYMSLKELENGDYELVYTEAF